MDDRAAPRAADPPSVRRCPIRRQGHIQRCSEAVATDRLAPSRFATAPGARQCPLPHAEIDGEKVSWRALLWIQHQSYSNSRTSQRPGGRPRAAAYWGAPVAVGSEARRRKVTLISRLRAHESETLGCKMVFGCAHSGLLER